MPTWVSPAPRADGSAAEFRAPDSFSSYWYKMGPALLGWIWLAPQGPCVWSLLLNAEKRADGTSKRGVPGKGLDLGGTAAQGVKELPVGLLGGLPKGSSRLSQAHCLLMGDRMCFPSHTLGASSWTLSFLNSESCRNTFLHRSLPWAFYYSDEKLTKTPLK